MRRGGFIWEDDGITYRSVREKDVPRWLERLPRAVGFMATDNIGELPETQRLGLDFTPLVPTSSRFVLAALPSAVRRLRSRAITVATSYPRLAATLLAEFGYVADELFVINGSVEAAAGLTDGIVDVVSTGGTLRANGFEIVEQFPYEVQLGAVARRNV